MGKRKKEIPLFKGPIIETHCHLDYLKTASIDEIINEAKSFGIEKIVTISVSPENFDEVLKISKSYDNVFCSQGIHPHDAKLSNDKALLKIKENSKDKKVIAIGEIGLDYYYTKSPVETQIKVFKEQLEIAIELDLPVIIHSRDADKDMIKILKEYAPQLEKKGVIHSFTSGLELAQTAIGLGFYIGINGIITFKNAKDVRDVIVKVPIEKMLLETDAPFLAPDPFRGKENAPKYLPLIAQKIAQLKNVEGGVESVLSTCYKNTLDLFSKMSL